MEKEKVPMVQATKDLGGLELSTAYMMVHGLVKTSEFTTQEVADCIGKSRQTLHLALTTDKYPFILMDVLKCLGYKSKMVIQTEIIKAGE